jgi:hypothetical protein
LDRNDCDQSNGPENAQIPVERDDFFVCDLSRVKTRN